MTDLAELNLPIIDEPNHPRLHQYVHQHTKDWSALVEGSDAFVFVTPEYNYGFNAALKNAIDYLHGEWQHKPAGIVSYGGVAAGTRAAQMLKQVLTALKMMPMLEAVNIPFVHSHLDEDGRLKPTEAMEASATAMLDELLRWTESMRSLRPSPRCCPRGGRTGSELLVQVSTAPFRRWTGLLVVMCFSVRRWSGISSP